MTEIEGSVNKIEQTEKPRNSFLINRIVKAQPICIQDAFQDALAASTSKWYQSRKDNLSKKLSMEESKRELLEVYQKAFRENKNRGLVPPTFDSDTFDFALKTWVALLTIRELLDTSLDFQPSSRSKYVKKALEVIPDSEYLKNLAKALFEAGEMKQKAFFIGNKKGKLFYDTEIEIIENELDRLTLNRV